MLFLLLLNLNLLSDKFIITRSNVLLIKKNLFRLQKEAPLCPDGSFTVTLDLKKELKEVTFAEAAFSPYLIALTPNAHLQVGIDYYSPKEYCVDA